jgi:enediyne biosynthesis protein E3
MGTLARRLFGIHLAETEVARRGFRVDDPGVRSRLEAIGETFVAGYHAGLRESDLSALARRLDEIELERRGFAFEGAAMALALKDSLLPWRRPAWRAFFEGAGNHHAYMVHVGAGWALARIGAPARRVIAAMDPLLRWLAFDGFGFHQGYFHFRDPAAGREAPRTLRGYERRAFDQGLGRSLWFAHGAVPARVSAAIATFAPSRHADLWGGVGLAAAYAGGATRDDLESLGVHAGADAPWLGQGASFAAQARARAGNPAAHTRLACEAFCGAGDAEAAAATHDALAACAGLADGHDYEAWRCALRDRWTRGGAGAETREVAWSAR